MNNRKPRGYIRATMLLQAESELEWLEKHYYQTNSNLSTASATLGVHKGSLWAFLKTNKYETKTQSECQSGELNGFSGKQHGEITKIQIGQTSKSRQNNVLRSEVNGRYGDSTDRFNGMAGTRYTSGIGLYRDRTLETRGAKCERCGKEGADTFIDVHHRDGNRENNADENLEVLCRSCHLRHHRQKEQHEDLD